jgi:signal transduction histidine kinase
VPIFASTGEVLGIFAMFSCEVHTPDPRECNLMELASQLAGIAVELNRAEKHRQATERNRQLEMQMAEMHKLNLLKDDFLSTISHELRTPLTNMKMALYLLEANAFDIREQRYLSILMEECQREADLINDLLDLQRLEAGRFPLEPEPLPLQEWLPAQLAPFLARIQERSQRLVVEIAPELKPLITDRSSLQRILSELINNACKYSPPDGRIAVQVFEAGAFYELDVTNSGPEIPEAELPHIFDKFYRVPGRDLWHQGGTGLGLSLVKNLVQRLGGQIGVTSSMGVTTFRVTLPMLG